MDKNHALLIAALDWISAHPDPPVIYAACHRVRSNTRPRPLLGFGFQASGAYDWWECNGVRYRIPNGHCRILCTDRGGCSSPPAEDAAYWIVTLDITGADGFNPFLNAPLELPDFSVQNPEQLIKLYERTIARYRLLEASNAKGETAAFRLRHGLKASLLELLLVIAEEADGIPHDDPVGKVYVIQARQWIQKEISNPNMGAEEIASATGLSVNRLDRLFLRHEGITPVRFLTRLRIAQAKELLLTTRLRIGEIARQLGFRDPLYFSRKFLRETGISPREFRKSNPSNKTG